MPSLLSIMIAVAAALLLAWLAIHHFGNRHPRALRGVLDAADALEARLRTARDEIEAVAGNEGEDPVRDAMREMLRQRLWLQEHADSASVNDLQTVRDSIDAARYRIEHQLVQIQHARAPLP